MTETEICNMALGELGAELLTNYSTDTTKRAILCRTFYPSILDAVLRAYPWNCALVRKTLAADVSAPIYGYDHKFPLPDNPYCLRILGIEDIDDFKIEGRFILCNESSINIRYISRIANTAIFDSLLVQAIAMRLAAVLSKPITGTVDGGLWQLYSSMVQEGRTMDGMEGTHDSWESNELTDVR